ncbi:MAG TPA: twin-arginine translocation pathway signal protein [Burkholderiaceae bacterium]|nr:twin-arginine translocation pathway signal protein [Burkholderiaceae bacterium]
MSTFVNLRLAKREFLALAAAAGLAFIPAVPALAASAAELSRDANNALQSLYAKVPAAGATGAKATAILVFPKVTKAGLGVGGQYGEGALLKGGKAVDYYSTAGVSTGLQIGAQTYGYAMFLMNDSAVKQLDAAQGFQSTTTTTMKGDIYAFIFSQKGLMGGLGIQGNKISKIEPK